MANITIGEVRFSYIHLMKPYAHTPGGEEKYSATILLPKSNVQAKAAIDAAIEEAKQRGIGGSWNGAAPKFVPTPIHDGDGVRPNGEEFGPECKGHWVFTANAKEDHRPEIVDANLQEIINPTEIYSGMYGKVSISFYPYNFNGRKGIGCGLGPVMKTRDGEALGGGRVTAAQAFGAPAGQASAGQAFGAPAGQASAGQSTLRRDPITGQVIDEGVPF